ncbi:hypothetical protein ACS5PU_08735 [Pedobacter sp. GSP4]|uniref:hypothetical protein n=1 Tax=Pedobacter sp. GSP4 TaxID=3453716 RepID=UPI003EEEE919
MANELKIRIVKDSKGNKLSLASIPIEAVESLKIFLDSFTTLANLYDNPSDFKVSITEGSVESNFIAPTNSKEFSQDIKDIIDGKLADVNKIKAFRSIQDKIKKNGLDYEVFWKINNKTSDLTQVFKGSNFPYKRHKNVNSSEIVFLKGGLFDAGGKTISNLHIEANNEEFTIGCSREEILEINQFMYSVIHISAIKTTKFNQRPSYTLIDYYLSSKEQLSIENFYKSIVKDDSLSKYDSIYDKLQTLLEYRDIKAIKYLINIFNNPFTERGILRTVLMTLKPYIKTKELKGLMRSYESLSATLRAESLNNRI